jgi:hypothetical protein
MAPASPRKAGTVTDRQVQVDAYVATWNESDMDKRLALIEKAWAEDGRYVAESSDVTGHSAINDNVVRIQEKYPNRIFLRTSDIFSLRDRARFTWAMLDPAGSATIAGVDYALFGADGRLRRITCVYDRKPRAGELGDRDDG